ncbi:hypothetical protein LLG96_17570 [bacterium]|nr:hypothetical protein [bacterium]
MIKRVLTLYLSCYLIIGGVISVKNAGAQAQKTYTIAALDLEGNGVSQSEAKGLSDKLRSHISGIMQQGVNLKAKYDLIERTQMDKILDQFAIQNVGCVSDSCAVEFGKMLQVDRIVIGSVNLIGQTYSVTARIIDIETGKTIGSTERSLRGSIDDVLTMVIPEVGNNLFLIPQKKSRTKLYILAGVVVLGAGAGAAMMGGGGGGGGETKVEYLPGPPSRP